MKKSLTLFFAVIASAIFMFGCSCSSSSENGTTGKGGVGPLMRKIKSKGEIVVYTNPSFPPYEYIGEEGIAGVEIDIVTNLAQKLGVKTKFVAAEFESIIGAVASKKADMGASGFSINDERKEKVDFSVPFATSVQFIVIPEGSDIKIIEDMSGKRIGVQNGTTGLLMLEDAINKSVLKDKNTIISSYNTSTDALVAMKAGKVEAVVIDEPVAIFLSKKNPGLITFPLVTANGRGLGATEEFAIIVPKGNQDFLDAINNVITEMKSNGSLAESIIKHSEASATKD